MRKLMIAGCAALALAGASISYAQQPASDGRMEQDRGRFGPMDMKAFTDARIAAIKAGLQLTPEQEKNWSQVEQTMREVAQARQERREQWRERMRDADGIARMRARADAMAARATELKRIADATEPLYRSLNDDQKKRLLPLMRMGMPHPHHGWMMGMWRRG